MIITVTMTIYAIFEIGCALKWCHHCGWRILWHCTVQASNIMYKGWIPAVGNPISNSWGGNISRGKYSWVFRNSELGWTFLTIPCNKEICLYLMLICVIRGTSFCKSLHLRYPGLVGYIGFTLSVGPSHMPCPLCNIYSSRWILSILGTNDHPHKRVCRALWPLTTTDICKVIQAWFCNKTAKICPSCMPCPLCNI